MPPGGGSPAAGPDLASAEAAGRGGVRRYVLALFSLLALVAFDAGAVQAEDPPKDPPRGQGHRLDLAEARHGAGFTRHLPAPRWRPGHAQILDTRVLDTPAGERRRLLRARHPETQQVTTLVDLDALAGLVPGGKGVGLGRIGRGGAPRFIWRDDGRALCCVVKGELVYVDLVQPFQRRLTRTAQDVLDPDAAQPLPSGPMRDVQVSPTGKHVAWSHGNELWVVPTREGRPRPLTSGSSETLLNATLDWVYPEELDYRSAIWWAPDGQRIAYLQMDQARVPRFRLPALLDLRGEGRRMFYPRAGDPNPRVRVGVIHPAVGKTVWLDAGAYEYIVRVAWTPDARRVLLVTLDRKQQHLRVVSCDPSGATATTTLFEMQTPGWFDAPPAPQFHDARHWTLRVPRPEGDRWLLLENEADHTRLRGKRFISPGGMDAGRLHGVDLAAGRAWFAASPHTSRRMELFESRWDAATPDRLDVGPPGFLGRGTAYREGSLRASFDPTHRYAHVHVSSVADPGRAALFRVDTGLLPASQSSAKGQRWRRLVLPRVIEGELPVEGTSARVRYRLYEPQPLRSGAVYPVIVDVYGGPGSRKTTDRWGGIVWKTFLTQRGYCVLEVDGRGSAGQGPPFRFMVRERLGVNEIADHARVVRHLARAYPWFDATRVGIWGWSYGGTMALNGLTMHPDVFHVGVAVAPVSDWRLYDTIYTERYMGTPQDNPEGYRESASLHHVAALRGQLLLMHGLGDDNVHAQNSFRFLERAIAAGKLEHVQLHVYPRRGHGIGGVGLEIFKRKMRWFDRHLRPETAPDATGNAAEEGK